MNDFLDHLMENMPPWWVWMLTAIGGVALGVVMYRVPFPF